MGSSTFIATLLLLASISAIRLAWGAGRAHAVNMILIITSIAFVSAAGLWAVAALLISIGVNYLCIKVLLSKTPGPDPIIRRSVLATSILFNIGMIVFARVMAQGSLLTLVGASYYSMQQITAVVDAYEDPAYLSGLIRARSYFAFVTFFPQIIAGPISTISETYNYFVSPTRPSERFISAGFFLLARGVFFSVVVGASLRCMAIPVLSHPSQANSTEAVLGVICTYLWLFFDFNGYSEIAMGCGLLLGVPLPQNFDKPLLAVTPGDFWSRWHMSLTRVLKAYLLRPLVCGPFCGAPQLASVVVLLAISMWHGVTLSFLVFGLISGLSVILSQTVLGRRVYSGLIGWLLTQGVFALTMPLVFVSLADCCEIWLGILKHPDPIGLFADITRGSKLAAMAGAISGLSIMWLDGSAGSLVKKFQPNQARVLYTAILLALSLIFYLSGNEAEVVYAEF